MERNLRSEMETVFIVTFRTGDICKPIHENCYFCTFPPRMTTGYLGETDFFFCFRRGSAIDDGWSGMGAKEAGADTVE